MDKNEAYDELSITNVAWVTRRRFPCIYAKSDHHSSGEFWIRDMFYVHLPEKKSTGFSRTNFTNSGRVPTFLYVNRKFF